ncbi:hypothetical protein pb186bvf_014036 [Paramecium bursaria]
MIRIFRLNLFQVGRLSFCQNKPIIEQSLSDESDIDVALPEIKIKENNPGFDIYQQLQSAKSMHQTLDFYQLNKDIFNVKNSYILLFHIFKLTLPQMINRQQRDLIGQDERFINLLNDLAQNFEETPPDTIINCLKIFVSLKGWNYPQMKQFATTLKSTIIDKIFIFSHLQCCELYYYFIISDWNLFIIIKQLREKLKGEQFVTYNLILIIKGSFILLQKDALRTQHADLAFTASQLLIPQLVNVTHNSKINIFVKLAQLSLQTTTTHKKFPQLIHTLYQYIQENYQNLNQFQKILIIQSYKTLPNNMDTTLYTLCKDNLMDPKETTINKLRASIALLNQRSDLLPTKAEQIAIVEQINKSNLEEQNPQVLIQFLNAASQIDYIRDNYKQLFKRIIQILSKKSFKNQTYMNLAKALFDLKLYAESFDVLKFDPENIYYMIQRANQIALQQLKLNREFNIQEHYKPVIALIDKLDDKSTLIRPILDINPVKNDPLFEYLYSILDFNTMQLNQKAYIISNIIKQNNINENFRQYLDSLDADIPLIKAILEKLTLKMMTSSNITKYISLWSVKQFKKQQETNSIVIDDYVHIFSKIILYCPGQIIYNNRGTVNQQLRELIYSISSFMSKNSQKVIISEPHIAKLKNKISYLNLRTSIMPNLIQNYCKYNEDPISTQFNVGFYLTDYQMKTFQDTKIISDFLNKLIEFEGSTLVYQIKRSRIILYMMESQKIIKFDVDDVLLKHEMEKLKQKTIEAKLPQSTKNYTEALLLQLQYAAWTFMNDEQDPEIIKFLENHLQNARPYLNLSIIRYFLLQIMEQLKRYNRYFEFARQFSKCFEILLGKFEITHEEEKMPNQVFIDFLEFYKFFRIENKQIEEKILNQISNLVPEMKQVQIVETLKSVADLKIYDTKLLAKISQQVLDKFQYYGPHEIFQILHNLARLNYFNKELVQKGIPLFTQVQEMTSSFYAIQQLWTVLLYYECINQEQISNTLTQILKNVIHQSKYINKKLNIPILFRQFMDIYNILSLFKFTQINFSIEQQKLITSFLDQSKNLVDTKFIIQQKLNKQQEQISFQLKRFNINFQANYLLDNQYVDYYLPDLKKVLIVDNSLYVTKDQQHYTGFRQFNIMILEALEKKYNIKVIRINDWQWSQMDKDQQKEVIEKLK